MQETRVSGWVTFAGIMILMVGVLNVIYGIGAIATADVLNAEASHFIFSSLTGWGWITLMIGVLQVLAGGSILNGGVFGVMLGMLMAVVGMVGALFVLPALPFWSIAVFSLSLLVAYGLAVHGGERAA